MNKTKINKSEIIILITLFCFAISLFNLAGYIFIVMSLITLLFFANKVSFSKIELLLILFSIAYSYFHYIHFGLSISDVVLLLIGPTCAFTIGRVYIRKSTMSNALVLFVLVLSFGMYCHGMLNILAYYRSSYIDYYDYYRHSVDFWRGELVNVKTTEMLFTFATGIALGVVFTNYPIKYRIASAGVIIASLGVSAFLANRTLIIIIAAVLVWRAIWWMANKKVSFTLKMATVLMLLCCVVLLAYLINSNAFGFRDYFYSLKITKRFLSDNETGRFNIWYSFFEKLRFLKSPFGGGDLVRVIGEEYFHNMWLDVYNISGCIPFAFLVCLTMVLFREFFSFSRILKRTGQYNLNIVFQSLMIAVLMNMMVEPIIEANPYYFLIIIMFSGAMNEYKKKMENLGEIVDCENKISI